MWVFWNVLQFSITSAKHKKIQIAKETATFKTLINSRKFHSNLETLDASLPTRYLICLRRVADMERLSSSLKEDSFSSGSWSPDRLSTSTTGRICTSFFNGWLLNVADPDQYVFGPQGSGSISTRYGTGSGSYYHLAKIVRKH
jgi:hypothetical protein